MIKQLKLTKAHWEKLKKFPYCSQDGKGYDAEVLIKFFNPYGLGTWLITEVVEGDTEDDLILYGYCHIHEWEWGSVSFKELRDVMVNVFGHPMPLEIDRHCEGWNVRKHLEYLGVEIDE